jgi:hypothetical protein
MDRSIICKTISIGLFYVSGDLDQFERYLLKEKLLSRGRAV